MAHTLKKKNKKIARPIVSSNHDAEECCPHVIVIYTIHTEGSEGLFYKFFTFLKYFICDINALTSLALLE